MALPVPNLDDRRFQDLVDESKRLVQQRVPEWSDHNVSDPGVTLIELFAWMTDQVIYRLNRVPDRNYVKFLELIGVSLFPPTASRTGLTFWLSAPQPDVKTIAAGTQAATVRTDTSEAIAFVTIEDLAIIPSDLGRFGSMVDGKTLRDHGETLDKGQGVSIFADVPQPGDAIYVGLTEAVPSNAVRLRFKATIDGVGVDPTDPPLAWEAWTGDDWEPCELDTDTTGGLNRDGDVIVHVPRGHVASLIAKQRAGWIRARVTPLVDGQPPYSSSPKVSGLVAITIGGTVEAVNAERVLAEEIGVSEGVPGQRFPLRRGPVVPGDGAPVLDVTAGTGWE
jgi:predicted phage baseplate assembly protein